MNDIKFRAWDLDNHIMHYQDEKDEDAHPIIWYCRSGEVFFEEYTVFDTCPGGTGHVQEWDYARPNQVVMQFTGLFDKHGKEIYRDDIVKYWGGVGLIVWISNTANFSIKSSKGSYFDFYPDLELEIIGNIHENPNLLNTNN